MPLKVYHRPSSAYDLYYMKEIIIDYLWRIGAHACWQLNELIKARPSWTINPTHVNRFREISIYYMLAYNLCIQSIAVVYYCQWCIKCMLSILHTVDIISMLYDTCGMQVLIQLINIHSHHLILTIILDWSEVYMSAQLMSISTIYIQRVLSCVWIDSLPFTYSSPSQSSWSSSTSS